RSSPSSTSASDTRSPSRSPAARRCSIRTTAGSAPDAIGPAMNILVCVKRVPATGGRIVLTPDGTDIDTRYLGFTVSPHEECAVEEAVRIVEAQGGSNAVLTLGPAAAEEQLRDAMAIGIDRAILLETDGRDWDPVATAGAIVASVGAQEAASGPFHLI